MALTAVSRVLRQQHFKHYSNFGQIGKLPALPWPEKYPGLRRNGLHVFMQTVQNLIIAIFFLIL